MPVVSKLREKQESGPVAFGGLGTALANNSNDLSTELTYTVGITRCKLELFFDDFAAAPTANEVAKVWLLHAPDGTQYEDGGTSVTPTRAPDAIFPVRAVDADQWVVVDNVRCPENGKTTALVRNETGQQMEITWYLEFTPLEISTET